MNLADELRDQIRSYIDGHSTLRDLRCWLADHAQGIADSENSVVEELDGTIWILVSELDYGHRDEENVRAALRLILEPVRVVREERSLASSQSWAATGTTASYPTRFSQQIPQASWRPAAICVGETH